MSTLSCGWSSWPFGPHAGQHACSCAARPSSWLRAASSASWPTPATSCSSKSKPLALPSPWIGGRGEREDLRVADAGEGAHRAAGDRRAADGRRFALAAQSLSRTKAMPAFWPAPPKLKPETVKTPSTASFSCFEVVVGRPASSARSVRSCVGADRQLHLVIRMPWSSSGRNDGGQPGEHAAHGHDDEPAKTTRKRLAAADACHATPSR